MPTFTYWHAECGSHQGATSVTADTVEDVAAKLVFSHPDGDCEVGAAFLKNSAEGLWMAYSYKSDDYYFISKESP